MRRKPESKPISMDDTLTRIRSTIGQLVVREEKLIVTEGKEKHIGIKSLCAAGGLSLQLFAFTCYAELLILHSHPEKDVTDELEEALLTYKDQLTHILAFLAEPLAFIVQKKQNFLVKPGDPGFRLPPENQNGNEQP